MSNAERQLEDAKVARRDAREALDTRLSAVRGDLDERSVGGRIADRVSEDTKAVLEEAQTVASAHRGLVAGTIAAIALWIFRDPLLSLIDRLLGRDEGHDDDE